MSGHRDRFRALPRIEQLVLRIKLRRSPDERWIALHDLGGMEFTEETTPGYERQRYWHNHDTVWPLLMSDWEGRVGYFSVWTAKKHGDCVLAPQRCS